MHFCTEFSVFCAYRSLPCIELSLLVVSLPLPYYLESDGCCVILGQVGVTSVRAQQCPLWPSLTLFLCTCSYHKQQHSCPWEQFSRSWSPLWYESKNKLLSLCMESWVSNYCHVKFSLYKSVFVDGLDTSENGGLYKMYIFYTIYELYQD